VEDEVSDQDMLLFQQLFKQHIGLHLPLSKKALLQSRLSHRLTNWAARLASTIASSAANRVPRSASAPSISSPPTKPISSASRVISISWRGTAAALERSGTPACLERGQCHRRRGLYPGHAAGQSPAAGSWSVFGSTSARGCCVSRAARSIPWRADRTSRAYLRRYCLLGTGEYEGHFLVQADLRAKVEFAQRNLTALHEHDDGLYDLIFLRNVIIYFDCDTKLQVLRDVIARLRPGGYLMVGIRNPCTAWRWTC
jgi:chemotaxis protein methyltransferase CheR